MMSSLEGLRSRHLTQQEGGKVNMTTHAMQGIPPHPARESAVVVKEPKLKVDLTRYVEDMPGRCLKF